MQPQSSSSASMHTVSNQSINVPLTSPSSLQPPNELESRRLFLKKLQQQGYVTLKINFQFTQTDKTKTVSKKIKANLNQKLLNIYVQMRKTFKEILAQRGMALRPEEGVFLFINGHRIVEYSKLLTKAGQTIKQMEKFMTNGPNGRYLEITGTTIEKFGGN